MTISNTPHIVERLKACPGCGGTWVNLNHPANGAAPYVLCKSCGFAGPQLAAASTDKQVAIAAWNTRTPDPVITAYEAALTAFVDAWDDVDHVFMPLMPGLVKQARAALSSKGTQP